MNALTMSVDDAAAPQPLAAGVFGAESSELEQSDTQLSCIDVDNSLRRSSVDPIPAEPRSDSSTQTGHIPNNEESDEDECIVRCSVSLALLSRPTLTAPRMNSSLTMVANRYAINTRTSRGLFAMQHLMLQCELLMPLLCWCPMGFFGFPLRNSVN